MLNQVIGLSYTWSSSIHISCIICNYHLNLALSCMSWVSKYQVLVVDINWSMNVNECRRWNLTWLLKGVPVMIYLTVLVVYYGFVHFVCGINLGTLTVLIYSPNDYQILKHKVKIFSSLLVNHHCTILFFNCGVYYKMIKMTMLVHFYQIFNCISYTHWSLTLLTDGFLKDISHLSFW